MRSRLGAVPVEIRWSAALLFGAGVVFLLLGVGLLAGDPHAGPAVLRLPVVATVLGLAVAAGLLLRWRTARAVAYVLLVVFALLHLVIVFESGPWWARLGSGVLAALYIYSAVLLNTAGAQRYLNGGTDG